VTGGEGCVGLSRIAVDQRPQIHRVRGAADLVLHGEQVSAICGIDDIAKAILVAIVLAGDETALRQRTIRTRKICEVYLNMVTVLFPLRPVALPEQEMLVLARCHRCDAAVPELCRHSHDL